MTYSRKTIEHPGDRLILEQAEAREIYSTWEKIKDKNFVLGRLERAEKVYGKGAQERIRTYLSQFKNGILQ